MCTAISLTTKYHYFGRNLDLDRSYGEAVCIMPRRFPLIFRKTERRDKHYAIIGMGTVVDKDEKQSYAEYGGLPLFYDATNEHGLSVAGLNFPENAYYPPLSDNPLEKVSACENKTLNQESTTVKKEAIAPFEFIQWILCQCKTVAEARKLISSTVIADMDFSQGLCVTPLHWMISDKKEDIVVEPMRKGLFVYENAAGVLTNNPPFEVQLENLKKYSHLTAQNKEISKENYTPYSSVSYGLGALGLPGDVSSPSRFVRAAFGRKNSVSEDDVLSSVGQFFHLLSSVEVARGVCKTDEGRLHFTRYSSCVNTDLGLYYYTTYENRRISCVDMHRTDLDGERISRYMLSETQSIEYQN